MRLTQEALYGSSPLLCGLSGKSQSHTVSGSQLGAPPCSLAHLPRRVHHGLSDAGRDIGTELKQKPRWTETGNADEGHSWLRRRFAPFIVVLKAVWWVHMGWHGFTYMFTCMFTQYGWCLRTAHQLFFPHSEGGFSCGKLLRKKQLRIPKQHTTMGDIICAMCVPFLSQFLSGMGLAIFNLRPTKPTYRLTTNWMKGRGGEWAL